MKIEKVSYQKTYSIGPYLTDRVGFEASIDMDDEYKALSILEGIADSWHKLAHPHLYKDECPIPITSAEQARQIASSGMRHPNVIVVEKEDKPLATLASIRSADTIEELSSFKLLASKEQQLMQAYMNRLKELTNVTNKD